MDTRADLLAAINADRPLTQLFDIARAADEGDDAHGLEHALRVARWTVRLAPDAMWREAIAAALLHDLVNVPKSSPDRHRASELSAEAARPHLAEAGFDNDAVDRIATAIRQHSFSRGERPTEALAMALQDADRLEALGAIGLMRCFATGERMGGALFDARDPWAEHRDLDDRRWSLDHLFTKLLALPDTMCTDAGRHEARARAAVIERFADAVANELGVPRPDLAAAR